ncbi:MAG TPA: hypothetical protein PLI93_03380 [Gemmatimonadales bacterium]|nr:hypothetical protein [Gemmatimonadales bacterium]HPF61080.1 hypothetical protein [Gemmatimonadales bacterium]HRX17840.1 hypothetical protein [Gemmatimonadales bacterium]
MTTPSQPARPASAGEGVVVGLIGAAVVALFYLGIDLAKGQPLMTPSILGEVFMFRRPEAVTTTADTSAVLLYTVAHLLVFIAFGSLLAWLTRRAELSSVARYAILPMVLLFEFAFLGVLLIASETTRGFFPLWSILIANLLAAVAMLAFLWRNHPRIRRAMGRAPLGAPDFANE